MVSAIDANGFIGGYTFTTSRALSPYLAGGD